MTTASVDSIPCTGYSSSRFERHKLWLLDLIAREPDLTLAEIRARLQSEQLLSSRSPSKKGYSAERITLTLPQLSG
jgi:hypothetical protein